MMEAYAESWNVRYKSGRRSFLRLRSDISPPFDPSCRPTRKSPLQPVDAGEGRHEDRAEEARRDEACAIFQLTEHRRRGQEFFRSRSTPPAG